LRGIGLVFLAAGLASGQPAPLPEKVTIERAVQEAIEKNLGLLAQRYELSIADARIVTAGLRPNPVFSFGADYLDMLGTGFDSVNAAGPSEVNFRTDFILERGGKRQKRIEVAKNARSVAQLQLLDATRTLVLDVQSGFVDVLLAKDTLTLAQENLKVFTEIVAINEARVKAGDLAKVELLRTQVAALQFQNAVRQAELKLHVARNRLQVLMGRAVRSENFDAAGELRRDQALVLAEDLKKQALELRPDLLVQKRDQARSLADIRLQLAQGKVDFTVGTQYHRQYDNAHGNAMGFFFSAPIPVFNRNQGEIERARREQQQIIARINALQLNIQNEVQNAHQQYSTARTLLASIERDMLQRARDVRQITEYSYRRGEASFVEFLDAQRAFNDTVQGYNEARAEFARSLYLLDSTSGKSVNP